MSGLLFISFTADSGIRLLLLRDTSICFLNCYIEANLADCSIDSVKQSSKITKTIATTIAITDDDVCRLLFFIKFIDDKGLIITPPFRNNHRPFLEDKKVTAVIFRHDRGNDL